MNDKYLKGRPFLILKHRSKPSSGQNTSTKDWIKGAEWEVSEIASFPDRVSDKDMIDSSLIIDIMKAKVIKSRFANTQNDKIMEHYIAKYKEKVQHAVANWMSRQPKEEIKENL